MNVRVGRVQVHTRCRAWWWGWRWWPNTVLESRKGLPPLRMFWWLGLGPVQVWVWRHRVTNGMATAAKRVAQPTTVKPVNTGSGASPVSISVDE